MSGEGKLSAVYKNGKKENSIYVSNAVKDIVFTEKQSLERTAGLL